LFFEVELISIGDTPPAVNVFKEIDGDKDMMLSRQEVRESLSERVRMNHFYTGGGII
jgi:hypothetical protein